MDAHAPDLNQHPPRSARVRLGGYVILPRMLDKCRATLAGKQGEYNYACPLDKRFLEFVSIDSDALKKEVAQGKTDGEILAWIDANAREKRSPAEIDQWSAWQEKRVPTDPDSRDYFNELHQKIAPSRHDISAWFDLLDLDDYISFGGQP